MGPNLQRWVLLLSIMFLLRNTAVLAGDELAVKTQGPAAIVTREHALVMEYLFDKTPFKPYVRQLYSPGGTNVLRDQVADHLHHHGLMFAVAADGVSYWDEFPTAGKQVHQTIEKTAAGLLQKLTWQGPNEQRPSLRETRRVEVSATLVGSTTLVTWRTRLQAAEGRAPVKLTGNHYFGLGMRFPESMDSASSFFTGSGPVDGEIVRGDERLTPGDWCAATSDNGGKPVTIALFDHPKNARRALWFTMGKPFAYLSASLNLHREPLQIEADRPLSLCYGVAVWDGETKANEIETMYRRWLEMNDRREQ